MYRFTTKMLCIRMDICGNAPCLEGCGPPKINGRAGDGVAGGWLMVSQET